MAMVGKVSLKSMAHCYLKLDSHYKDDIYREETDICKNFIFLLCEDMHTKTLGEWFKKITNIKSKW